MIKINDNVSLDTSNLKIKDGKTFARLVCTDKFISQARLIEQGQCGAWIRVKKLNLGGKEIFFHNLHLGKNSWLAPGFRGTDCNDSHIHGKLFIGENTYIGGNTQIQNNVYIGNNCYVGFAARFGKNSRICDDCYLENLSQVGNNVYIGNNTIIGRENTDGTIIGFTCYIGASPNLNKLYRKKKIQFGLRPLIENKKYILSTIKRNIAESIYSKKRTIIGENVHISTDCKIEVGSVIGDEAKLGRFAHVLKNGRIPNKSNIAKKEVVKTI